MPVQKIIALPWLLQSARTKYFILTVHYFNSFVSIDQRAGHAVEQGRLSLNVCVFATNIERKIGDGRMLNNTRF
jgi:hypothetical protein